MNKIEFIMSGKIYRFDDLGEKMNNSFSNLLKAWIGNDSLLLEEFKRNSYDFFNQNKENYTIQDIYISNFTIITSQYYQNREYEEIDNVWQIVYNIVRTWEQNNIGYRIHKGSLFYFWSVNSLLKGDIDKCYLLMHQAFEEDKKSTGIEKPELPAFWFVSLNPENKHYIYNFWILHQINFIKGQIEDYKKNGGILKFEDFNIIFLKNYSNIDILFMFSYLIGRLLLLRKIPFEIKHNNFASQIELNLIFNFAIIIEELLKEKYFSTNSKSNIKKEVINIPQLCAFLGKKKTQNKLCQNDYGDINGKFNDNFSNTLASLLKNSLNINDKDLTLNETNLAIWYGLRNKAAHDITANKIIYDHFDELINSLFFVFFWIIEDLY